MENQVQKISLLISRFFAFVTDSLIIISALILFPKSYAENLELSELELIILLIIIFELYFFLFELILKATPGKLLFGLRVRYISNNVFSSSLRRFFEFSFRLFIRNFSRLLIFIPPLFLWNEFLILIFYDGKSFSEVITKLKVNFKS